MLCGGLNHCMALIYCTCASYLRMLYNAKRENQQKNEKSYSFRAKYSASDSRGECSFLVFVVL